MKQSYTILLAFALQFCFFNSMNAQQSLLRARVLVEGEKEGAAGASIKVMGQMKGTSTDGEGYFELMVDKKDQLLFSYAGCESLVYTIPEIDMELNHQVILPAGVWLNEVVITADKLITKKADGRGCGRGCGGDPENTIKLSISLDKTWSYYPNPTVEGVLVATEEQTGYINVFPTDGCLVGRTLVTDINTKVPMDELPAGTYLLLYENADWQSVIGKAIKIKK